MNQPPLPESRATQTPKVAQATVSATRPMTRPNRPAVSLRADGRADAATLMGQTVG